jgi:serine/threonine protein kinase
MISLKNKNNKYYIDNNEVVIEELCGKGSYGVVYNCSYLNNKYVIKFSNNENPETLKQRYEILKEICVKHIYFGKIINDKEYKYFSIMENGGQILKLYKIDKSNFNIIIKQLHYIVEYIKNHNILQPDLKLSNIVVKDNVVKLIDIYMDCDDCKSNKNCKIVRTFSIIDLSNKLHESEKYNYTYIYPLYAFLLLELTNNKLSSLCNKFNKEYGKKYKPKKFAILLQLSIIYENKKKFSNYIYDDLKLQLKYEHKKIKHIYNFIFNNINSSIENLNDILLYLLIPIPELRKNIEFI